MTLSWTFVSTRMPRDTQWDPSLAITVALVVLLLEVKHPLAELCGDLLVQY